MSDLEGLWRSNWMGELGRHLAETLSPLLPDGRELLATGSHLVLTARDGNGRSGVRVSYALPVPGDGAVLDADAAAEVLEDLQDEIAISLGRAWPVAGSGAALTATAAPSPEGIDLSFVSRSGDDVLRLDPFRPPPPLDQAHVAG